MFASISALKYYKVHRKNNLFISTRRIFLTAITLLLNQIGEFSSFILTEQSNAPIRYPGSNLVITSSGSSEFANVGKVVDESRIKLLAKYNYHEGARLVNKTLRNFCYCSYGAPACDYGEICVKHEMAACFHAIRQVYATDSGHFSNQHSSAYAGDTESGEDEIVEGGEKAVTRGGFMQTQHYYGCAPLEHGSNASHLTCNSWRSIQSTPSSIACCYEGHFCNVNITPLTRNYENRTALLERNETVGAIYSKLFAALVSVGVGILVGSVILLFVFLVFLPLCVRRHEKYAKEKLPSWLWVRIETLGRDKKGSLFDASTTCDQRLLQGCIMDGKSRPIGSGEFFDFDATNSGSGSGGITLNQRTIALDLTMLETVARGRYGEVCKAIYRGSIVAVKTFYTTEEESWKNERDIYQTQMLNHENILQYVAADISSNVESLTQMMLITDYHDYGSLYDYLRQRRGCNFCCQSVVPVDMSSQSDAEVSDTQCSHYTIYCSCSSSAGGIFSQDTTRRAVSFPARSAKPLKATCSCCRLSLNEALQIAFSIISGVEHLHNALRGTGSRRKPEIAHRDIKSKNIIVKRPGVCCVADFGLAVRYENNVILPKNINIQVGTKRYMAPEVLARTLNTANFDEFKAADIYSFALVLWEVLQMAQFDEAAMSPHPAIGAESASGNSKHQRRIISRSSSSGIATGASDRSASYLLPNHYFHQYRNGDYQNQLQEEIKHHKVIEKLERPATNLIAQAQAQLLDNYSNSYISSHHSNCKSENSRRSSTTNSCSRLDDTHNYANIFISQNGDAYLNTSIKKDSSYINSLEFDKTVSKLAAIRQYSSAPNATININNDVTNTEQIVIASKRVEDKSSSCCLSQQKQQKLEFNREIAIVEHRLPYQDLVESDPSFEEMRRIVCETKMRPTLENRTHGQIMRRLSELMNECWSENAKSRHTSLKVKKEIGSLRVCGNF